MQRHQFEAYLDKVFDWQRLTAALSEGRQYPLHPWSVAFDAVFLGSACQFGPLHRIETECRSGTLHKRIGSLSEDMLGYAMQRQNPAEIFDLGCQVAKQLKRNGVLKSDWARGLSCLQVYNGGAIGLGTKGKGRACRPWNGRIVGPKPRRCPTTC